jgi:hypothetical protein
LRSLSCDKDISSGITHPFGWLSQSPGHISDSLLSRSPLCIATPYDLHVLATPPAFRLSQDQTLQLISLAQELLQPQVFPPSKLGGLYWGLTLSYPAFILEMSLSKPNETRLSRMAVTAFPSAKTVGQSVFKFPGCKHPRLSIPNARLKHSRWHSTQTYDQGRSLTCVHHEND